MALVIDSSFPRRSGPVHRRFAARAALFAATSLGAIAASNTATVAATVTWDGSSSVTGNGTAWFTFTNWVGDAAVPGPTELAEIVATGTQPNIGINMNSASVNNGPNNQAVGAIRLSSGTRTLQNSSTAASGTLTLKGDGTSVLLSNTTASGTFTIAKNVAASNAMAVALDVSGDVDVTNAGATLVISSDISNGLVSASLTKTGAGNFTLLGQNTFEDASGTSVTVNAGSLTVANTAGAGVSGKVVVNNSGSVLASGANITSAISGSATLSFGTVAEPGGIGTLGTLALGSLLANDSTLNFDLSDLGQDLINSGPVTLTGTNTVNVAGANFALGEYVLLNYPSIGGPGFTLGSTPSIPSFLFELVTGPTATVLKVTVPEPASLGLLLAPMIVRLRRRRN